MKKRGYVLSLALIITLLMIYILLRSENQLINPFEKKGGSMERENNPASKYAIQMEDIENLQKRANSGDCDAAQRLGLFHMNYTLEYDNAVKWFRVAAKCPDVTSKEYLIILLVHVKNHPEVAAEVDRLVLEIQSIDAKKAAKIKANVDGARSEGSSEKSP
ncbi:MAG: hypothetical protein V4484_22130 [Pseudomonadota bacterium]